MDKHIEHHLDTIRRHLLDADPGMVIVRLSPITCIDDTFYEYFTDRCCEVASDYGVVEDMLISGDTCEIVVIKE